MKGKIILFFLCISISTDVIGQTFVYSDTSTRFNIHGTYSIGLFNIATCQDSFIVVDATSGIEDFAYGTDGRAYMYTVSRFTPSLPPGIYRSGASTLASYGFRGSLNEEANALSCGGVNLLYAARKGLSRFNLTTRQSEYLGDFPSSMESAGDLTYRDGKLYLSTISNTLVEVNIDNPFNSRVFMHFPEGTPPIQGLASFPNGCDSTDTYAIGVDTSGSIIYKIDFNNKTIQEVCRTTRHIIGAASATECSPNSCNIFVDLDKDNSSGATRFDYRSDTVCLSGFFAFDVDMDINADEPIDSITIHLSNPIDIGQENFTLADTANVLIEGAGTSHLKILNNNGTSTIQDFEKTVSLVIYHNNSTSLSYGDREIWVRAYSPSFVSQVATSRLILRNRLHLETTVTPVSCHNLQDGAISLNIKGDVVPTRYRWSDGSTAMNRNQLQAGSYIVTVSDHVGCKITDTLLVSQPDSLFVIINTTSDTVCGNSGKLTASVLGGTTPYQYNWNGVTTVNDSIIENLGAGKYFVNVKDKNGCQASSTYDLFKSDTIKIQQQITLCEGDFFEWQGQQIMTDTSVCALFRSAQGCDSLHCIEVQFLDSVLVQKEVTLCNNETYNFNGQIINRDTMICQVFRGTNDCDSTYCLTVKVVKRINQLTAHICEGESYSFAGRMLTASGIYTDTIPNSGQCDSLIVLNLQVNAKPIVELLTNGSLCEGGSLKIDATAGFQNYVWSTGATTPSINITSPGSYNVIITSATGCKDTASIQIANESFQPLITAFNPACFGTKDGSIVIDTVVGGNPPYSYRLNNQPAQILNQFDQLGAGTYQLEVEDNNGCFVQTTVTLTEPEPLTLTIGDDTTLSLGDSLVLTAQTNAINPLIQWNPPTGLSCATCLTTVAKPIESIRYEVTLTDPSGCVAKEEIAIQINQHTGVFIPNAFSPNGDGVNDVFTIFADGSVKQINYLRVFDRWGNLVYEAKDVASGDIKKGWDGTFNQEILPDGIYVYTLEFERIDGIKDKLQGAVLLVK